jgi:hypothetical protein
MDKNRTPEELSEMEGGLDDLKQVETEGFEGHEKGGADLKFVSQTEQAKRKEAAITEVDRNFVEYIQTKAVLVAKKSLFERLNLGEIQKTTRNNYLHSVIREVMFNQGLKGAHYQMNSKDDFLICIIGEQGDLYKLSLKISEIPGATEAIDQDPRFNKHSINFLKEQFMLAGFDYRHIGSYRYLTNRDDIKLETLFSDLESIKQ